MDPMQLGTFWPSVLSILGGPLVKGVLGLILVKFISGIAVACKQGTFQLGAVGEIMKPVAWYVVGGACVSIIGYTVPPEWGGVSEVAVNGTWVVIGLALVGQCFQNINELLGRDVIPASLANPPVAPSPPVPRPVPPV